jgi:hypothetical protein
MVTCSVWRRVGLEIWADGVHGSDDFLLATVHKTPWGRGSADDNADLIVQAPALCARIAELEAQVPHPGDGSCDKCGAVPAMHVPMVLCPKCYGDEKRIAELERELAETRALLAEDPNTAGPVEVPRGRKGGV